MIALCGELYFDDESLNAVPMISDNVKCNLPQGHPDDHVFLGYLTPHGNKVRVRLQWNNFKEQGFDYYDASKCNSKIFMNSKIVICDKSKDHEGFHYSEYRSNSLGFEYEWGDKGNGDSRIDIPEETVTDNNAT